MKVYKIYDSSGTLLQEFIESDDFLILNLASDDYVESFPVGNHSDCLTEPIESNIQEK